MGFRINTNIASLNAQSNGSKVNRNLELSMAKLSSGLRINTAADDASGMVIADSLKSQGNALGQSIKNANDAIGIVQTADKAMDEQIKILDIIKTKATQAAADGQSADSRMAIQNDITKLMEELDNISNSTTFNGLSLLSGSFTNKEFQIGAYSNQTIKVSIGDTTSAKIGSTQLKTTSTVTASGSTTLKFTNSDGSNVNINNVVISSSAGTGLGALAEAINKQSNNTGVSASFKTQTTGSGAVAAGNVRGLIINGTTVGDVLNVLAADSDGKLVNAINQVSVSTGITASIDNTGKIALTSNDGRGIVIKSSGSGTAATLNIANAGTITQNFGRLTLTSLGAKSMVISASNSTLNTAINTNATSYTANLREVVGQFKASAGLAAGAFSNKAESAAAGSFLGSGVTTKTGAMMVMNIAESALKQLDKIRASLGSTQNQLTSTISNISTTQVNVFAAESNIRDVDYAEESANYSKNNILAQAGSYAMMQANMTQQMVLKLLQ